MSNAALGDRRYPKTLWDVRPAAQRAAANLGWHLMPAAEGCLHAVWTSKVFGFKDDVVIQFHGEEGTLVRVESRSRGGVFDFGQNARHVREFFDELERELAPAGRQDK